MEKFTMFFLLSKLLINFVYPLSWILVLLIVAVIIKNNKHKQKLLLISFVLLVIFSNPFLFDNFAKAWDIDPASLKKSQYSCVIVLGGFSSGHGKNGFFNGTADRFIQGLKLLETHRATHILISGGNGNLLPDNFRESTWVKTQLIDFNVPDSCILIEPSSRNTIENAAYSKTLLKNGKLQPPFLLVTSAFHMRRSLSIFKRAGIDVIPFPSNFMRGTGNFSFDEFIPDAVVLERWNTYIKEVIGVTVNNLRFPK
ncbi:MAG TPA: YdcF family protein [Mucilaginibacter sp.]|jgi:uncharacterized SAM-binding protein YcdF (DUF218 family)